MFEKFTAHARRIIVLAQEQAQELGHRSIGTEHILLGLMHDGQGVANEALASAGVQLDVFREAVVEIRGRGTEQLPETLGFTPNARGALQESERVSSDLGHESIDAEHMILGLISANQGLGVQLLVDAGVSLERLRKGILAQLPEATGAVLPEQELPVVAEAQSETILQSVTKGVLGTLRGHVQTILGLALVALVAVGTVVLAPVLSPVLERMPGLVYLYTGGEAPAHENREDAEPLPFETAGISTEELLAVGLPVGPGPSFREVDADTIYPRGHAVSDAANEQMILSSRSALWTWDAGTPGFGIEIIISEHPTERWAQSAANIWEYDLPGTEAYPQGATHAFESQLEPEVYEAAKVQFVHDRLWVRVQMGTGPAYAAAVSNGTAESLDVAELARQVAVALDANLPVLDDLEGWTTLQVPDLRIANAASLGLAASLTILVRALGSTLLDRGSRETFSGLFRRRIKPEVDDVDLTPRVRWWRFTYFVRTLVLALSAGAGFILLYFLSGALGLVPMFLLVGVSLLAVALAATFLRRRKPDEKLGRSWLFAEATATALSSIVVAAGIYCVGMAGIGFTMGDALIGRMLSLVMLLVGLVIVGFAHIPAQLFRRLAMPVIKKTLEQDTRAPVLFLRSFQDDDLPVRVHPKSKTSPAARLALLKDSTFEDLIAWQAAEIGPVIAIGQPGTLLQPLGAVRDYFSDDEWQTAVLKRINISAAVIFVVGRSPGAQWELAQLRERGALGKTLFVFPPVPEDEFDKRCFVLATGLGLHPLRLNGDIDSGVPLVAMRIGERGEIIRYLADARDDLAYTLALEEGLAEVTAIRTVVTGPAESREDLADAAQAQSLLARYNPARRRMRSSDPFRSALRAVLSFMD